MRKTIILILAIIPFLECQALDKSCDAPPTPSLEEQVKSADLILIGKVREVKPAEVPTETYNKFALVDVKEVLKGEALKVAKVFYLSYGSKFNGRTVDECHQDQPGASFMDPKDYGTASKIYRELSERDRLVFAKKIDGGYFTNGKFGGGSQWLPSYSKVVEMVRKMLPKKAPAKGIRKRGN